MPRNNDIGLENLTAAIAALAAGNGVFFGLGLGAVALTSWLRSRHAAQALEQVKSTPLTPLADVKSLFEVTSRDKRVLESDQARSNTADGPEDFASSDTSASPRFAIVRGEVQPRAGWRFYGSQDESPLKSEFAPEEAPKCVLTRKTQTYGHVELDGSFRIKEAPMSDLLKQIPFVLRDSRARDTRVHVDWQGSPKDWLPLECVYRNFQPGAASGTQAFVFLVFGQSCPVGVVTEERVLKVGTELTAVGHMFKTGDGMSIRPAEGMPLFMTKMNKDEIVEALRVESLVHRWTGILTGVIAGSILVYAAGRLCHRVYKEWRRRRNLYRNSRPPLNPAENAPQSPPQQQSIMASESGVADDADDVAPPGEACVICLTRTRRAVFLNCGHRAACFRCAQRVAEGQKICPLCRQAIVGVVRVYDP